MAFKQIKRKHNQQLPPSSGDNGSKIITLKQAPIGTKAIITAVGGEGALRQHLLDMGVIPGSEVTVVQLAPMGDPMEVRIHGYELTLRIADAEKIKVIPAGACSANETADAQATDNPQDSAVPSSIAREAYENASHAQKPENDSKGGRKPLRPRTEHPGLGEAGRFHQPGDGDPLPDDTLLTFALVGNQNCGKTTLFNIITGLNRPQKGSVILN